MNKKVTAIIIGIVSVLIVLLVVLLAFNKDSYDGDVISVYYLNNISSPVSEPALAMVKVPVGRSGDRVEQAVRILLSDPVEDGLSRPFPIGVNLLGIAYAGEDITVHLSEEYGELYGVALACANACTVLTLCEIEGVSTVSITVEGKPHPAFSATKLSVENIVTGDMSLRPVELQAVLYYSDGNTEYVVGERKNIIMRENESIARYVVEELIKGPDSDSSAEGYKRIINPNTKLLNIEVSNNICYVNLSKEFLDGLYKSKAIEVQTLYSITNSLCSTESIEGVQFLVEGERIYGNEVMRKNESVIGHYKDETITINLYVISQDNKYLEMLPTRIDAVSGFDIERLVVEKLISGIDGYGFMSVIPKGTMLLGVERDRQTCIVNFSKEFTSNYADNYDMNLIVQSIVTSLTSANNNIQNVLLLVEGKDFGDGKPIYPDNSLVGVG